MTSPDYHEVLSPKLYYDHHCDVEAAKIMPGEYSVTTRAMLVVTVLGSCVSACLRDIFPRKVDYFPKTGRALIKKTERRSQQHHRGTREGLRARLDYAKRREGDVELF